MMEIRKIEWVITMTCEERVKSEEYREVLRDYKYTEAETSEGVYDYCRVEVDSDIYIIYFKPGLGTPSDINLFPYYEIPKCYGLMQQEETDGSQIFDSLALAEAGILQIQKKTAKGMAIAGIVCSAIGILLTALISIYAGFIQRQYMDSPMYNEILQEIMDEMYDY